MNDTPIAALIRTPDEADLIDTEVMRRVMARGADTGGRFALSVVTIPTGFRGPNLHRHQDADEMFFVLEGEFVFRAAEDLRRVGSGAFIYVPAGTPHTFALASSQPGRQIVMYTPSGPEAWFDELAGLRARGATSEEFAAARERYGVGHDVLGPPLERSEIDRARHA